MRSLRAQLSIGLLLSLAAVFAAQWLIVRMAIPRMVETLIADELAEDADELLAAMNLAGTKEFQLYRPDKTFAALHSDHFHEVLIGPTVAYASPSLSGKALGTAPLPKGAWLQRRVAGPGARQLLVRSQGYESQGEAVTIAVGVDIARVNRRMNEFLWGYSALSGVMLACLALLQGWVLRRALRVLARVRAELAQVRQGAAQEVDEHVPSEIAPLVGEINQLTRAAALRLQRSRRALGNLAHALKTPLTVLRQLAQDEHLSDRPSVADALTEQVDLLRRRVDLELRRGRLAGHGGSAHRVDICAEMRALVQTIASLYRDKRLDIVCDAPAQAHFQGDREDMLELFGNLLDNACKYGEHQVRVSVREDDGVHFVFEDDGPGCAPEQFERLTRRGVRLDERVHGHGLGLAIAADIVASYSGTLELARSGQLGGLRASVWLPFVTNPPHTPPIALNEREYSFTTKN